MQDNRVMEEQCNVSDEIVTLVLGENRIDVHKEKLASKSHYFANLFSHNFNDYQEKIHVINYDISLSTLQVSWHLLLIKIYGFLINFEVPASLFPNNKDVINWIHDDEYSMLDNCHYIKPCMAKFLIENFVELTSLLQLSVLFTIDTLINDIIDIIILHWLIPEKVIDIWILAQELGLNVLRDVSLAVCLDRFKELPMTSLVDLSRCNISLLLQNNNIRCCKQYISYISTAWSNYHREPSINISKERKGPKFLECKLGYKVDEFGNKKGCVYFFDNEEVDKSLELTDVKGFGQKVIGLQAIGRGFSIYIIGGENGWGTGQFNTVIWRYCLISKKWYYQAKYYRLPVPRRHMALAFLSNKLMVVGGVGRYRLKLSTVDVLDIHTGKWGKAANVPEDFTLVPYHFVVEGKLFLRCGRLYVYDPESDYWSEIVCMSPDLQEHPMPRKEDCKHYEIVEKLPSSNGTMNVICAYHDGQVMFFTTLQDESDIQTKVKSDLLQMGHFNVIDPRSLYNQSSA